MAISFVGSLAGTHAATSAQTVNFSSLLNAAGVAPTLAQNDIVVVTVFQSQAGTAAFRTQAQLLPTGYTAAHASVLTSSDTNDSSMQVSYKFMGATPDTNVSIPASFATTSGVAYSIHVFRGVSTGVPLDVTTTTATGSNTAIPDAPSITPVTAGAWIYCVGGGAMATGTAPSSTAPTGLDTTTNAFKTAIITSTTNDAGIAAGYNSSWTSGAFDCPVFGGFNSTNTGSWTAATLALRPTPQIYTVSATLVGAGNIAAAIKEIIPVTSSLQGSGNITAAVTAILPVTTGSAVALTTTNGIDKNSNAVISGGGLTVTGGSSTTGSAWLVRANGTNSGKLQFEITVGSGYVEPNVLYIGIDDGSADFSSITTAPGQSGNGLVAKIMWVLSVPHVFFYYDGINADSSSAAVAIGDVITLEYDTVNGTASFFRNGSLLSGPYTGLSASTFAHAFVGVEGLGSLTANFTGPFAYPQTGYSAFGTSTSLLGNATIAADATIVSPGPVTYNVTAALTGGSVIGASISDIVPIASSLQGNANINATIFNIIPVGNAFTGGSILSATIGDIERVTASLLGASAISAAITDIIPVNASLQGNASITGSIVEFALTGANLSGNANTSATIFNIIPVSATLNGNANINATINDIIPVTTALQGNGNISGTIGTIMPVATDLQGNGNIGANIVEIIPVASALQGNANLLCNASINGTATTYNVTAALVGSGNINANVVEIAQISASLVGGSFCGGIIIDDIPVTCTAIGSGSLSADARTLIPVSATLTGGSSLNASVTATIVINAPLNGNGNATGQIIDVIPVTCATNGNGNIDATAVTIIPTASTQMGNSILGATATNIIPVSCNLVGQSNMTASTNVIIPMSFAGTAGGLETAQIVELLIGRSALTGSAQVNASVNLIRSKRPNRSIYWF